MRWLFLFVLIVNIAYVAWEFNHSGDDVTVLIADKNVPTIMLLSELRQAEEPVEQPADMTGEMIEKESAVQDEAKAEAGQGDTEQAVSEPIVVAAEAEACFTLGPFRELENLRAFTRAIKDYVVEASFRSREEQEQSMFWVYLPPSANFSKAKVLSSRLEKMKIRDYYIVSKGDQKNGISLGHFKEKDRAYTYAGSIKKLGFRPIVEPVFRNYTIYWLDYRVVAGKQIPKELIDKHMTERMSQLNRDC